MNEINKYSFGGDVLGAIKNIIQKASGYADMLTPANPLKRTSMHGIMMPAPPEYSDVRGRKRYRMHPTGQKHTSPQCAHFVNRYFKRERGGGNAWTHDYVKPYINGYEGITLKDRKGNSYQNHYSYNLDAAENLKKKLDISKLNPKQSYVANMYVNLSPWDYKSRKGNSYSQGTHTGVLLHNGKDWVVRHNFHGNIMEDPLKDLLGSNYDIGVTSIMTQK